MKKVVLALSGGMDSSTLAGFYLNKGYEVHPIAFSYGSKHGQYEQESAFNVAADLGTEEIKLVELDFIGKLFTSNLLKSGGDIPEGHYEDESMSKTVVPGRNTIFISILMGYAESIGANIIAAGVHAGDHHIYPDCREDFINAMALTVAEATEGAIRLEAPFIDYDKYDILKIGYGFKVIPPMKYELTRTCYKDQPLSCGKCGSCVERLEAFAKLGKPDPIEYER